MGMKERVLQVMETVKVTEEGEVTMELSYIPDKIKAILKSLLYKNKILWEHMVVSS